MKSFKKYAGKDNKITESAFIVAVSESMDEDLARKVFASFDADHNGTLEIDEYLTMMGVLHWGSIEQKLKASFSLFDKNGDGQLSPKEINEMFVSMVKQKRAGELSEKTKTKVLTSTITLSEKDLDSINRVVLTVFEKVDTDKSGEIDYQEFITGFTTHPDICGFFKQF